MTQVTLQPALRVDEDMQQIGTACVGVHNLDLAEGKLQIPRDGAR